MARYYNRYNRYENRYNNRYQGQGYGQGYKPYRNQSSTDALTGKPFERTKMQYMSLGIIKFFAAVIDNLDKYPDLKTVLQCTVTPDNAKRPSKDEWTELINKLSNIPNAIV